MNRLPVAIVGAGLGGLSAAIHLRVAGFDVSVFEKNDRVGGRASQLERRGYRFDTGPSLLNYPWVFRELFRHAGRRFEDAVQLLPVDPSVMFRWPDGSRLSLSSDLQTLLQEFERIEPGSSPGTLAFMRAARKRYEIAFTRLVNRNEDRYVSWIRQAGLRELAGLGVGRSLDSELRRYFRSPRIREALGSYAMYLGASPYELPGFFSILPYGELAYGLWLPKGGIYGLVSAIEQLARDIGVQIHTTTGVRRILTRGGAVTGLELESGERLDAPLVISNVDVPTTDTMLLEEPRLAARARRTRMTPAVLTFYWGLRARVEGDGHHTIYLPEDSRSTFSDLFRRRILPQQPAFYVSVPSATDPSLAPDGCSAVFVLVPTPLISDMPGADWASLTREIRGRVLERLARHGVDLPRAAFEVEEAYTPVDWRQRFGLHDGSAFGAAHTLRQLGPWRAPNYRSKPSGLFYVGASTTPGTGMPMVILSGKLVAERVLMLTRRQPALRVAEALS